MPYYNLQFDDEGEAIPAGEYYEAAEKEVSFAGAEDWVAGIHQSLIELGYVAVIVRYDGGHDEGFAYFHRAEHSDGRARDAHFVAQQLLSLPVARHTVPREYPKGVRRIGDTILFQMPNPSQAMGILMDGFADHAASQLLGDGYGTGEYTLRGWFRLDLKNSRAVDLLEEP
jgi:hypothetical protein